MSEMKNLESYPPVLRQLKREYNGESINQSQNQGDPGDSVKDTEGLDDLIPVVDLQCLDLDKLREACVHWGLFRLVNHGVPLGLLNRIHEHAKSLLALSYESKQALFTSPLSYFWGTPALTPSGAALHGDRQNINLVEGLHVPLSEISLFQAQDPMLESFRASIEEYGRHLARLAATLFEAMAKNLNLDPGTSRSYLSESTGIVRVHRYPVSDEGLGMEVHSDSSVLSILTEDQVGGLEILKDNQWLNVKPVPSTLLVNIGDMTQAMSNDEYISVMHKVKVAKQKERYSICYFVFPAPDCVIRSSKYKPFTYTEFRAQVLEDVRTVGCKVGLDRFKLPDA